MNNSNKLFDQFSPITKAEWLEKLTKDLKGRAFEELQWQLGDDKIDPFYHPEDEIESSSIAWKSNNDWEIGEDFVSDGDFKKLNKQLLTALENGVNSPRLIIKKGLEKEDLEILFKGIRLDFISIHFLVPYTTLALRNLISFAVFCKHAGYAPEAIKGTIHAPLFQELDTPTKSEFFHHIKEYLPNFNLFAIDAIPFYTDSNGIVDELFNTIKAGHEVLAFYHNLKVSATEIANKIQFSIAIGKDYFVAIAKIRALKLLWFTVLDAYGLEPNISINVEFDPQSQSRNPNNNMIYATTQAMAAVIGGANRLSVLPSDAKKEAATSDFARRIARNVQHLLKMESHLDVVQDPAAGSYYIEKLTEVLAEKAWEKCSANL